MGKHQIAGSEIARKSRDRDRGMLFAETLGQTTASCARIFDLARSEQTDVPISGASPVHVGGGIDIRESELRIVPAYLAVFCVSRLRHAVEKEDRSTAAAVSIA